MSKIPYRLDAVAAAALVLTMASCGAAAKGSGYYKPAEPGYYGGSYGAVTTEAYSGGGGGGDAAYYGEGYGSGSSGSYDEYAQPMPAAPASSGGYYEAESVSYEFADDGIMGDLLKPDGDVDYAKAWAGPTGGPIYADLGTKDKAGATQPPTLPGPQLAPPDQPPATDAGGKKDRLMIYNAEISLAVFRVEEQLEEIEKKIDGWGGYLVSMDTAQVTFRVPAEKFDEAIDEIAKLGDVTYKNVSGTDVTEEFMDLQIRLANAIAMRDRFVELLSQAKTVDDSLKVEAELDRITEEIELMKGRLKYLSEAAMYSKITVYFSVKKKAKKPLPPLYAPFQWIQDIGLDTLFGF